MSPSFHKGVYSIYNNIIKDIMKGDTPFFLHYLYILKRSTIQCVSMKLDSTGLQNTSLLTLPQRMYLNEPSEIKEWK